MAKYSTNNQAIWSHCLEAKNKYLRERYMYGKDERERERSLASSEMQSLTSAQKGRKKRPKTDGRRERGREYVSMCLCDRERVCVTDDG